MLMLFHTAVTSHPLEKQIQRGIQHLHREGYSHILAGTQIKCLLQASILCYSLLSLTKLRDSEAHQSTSALCSSVEIAVFTLFQICGLKLSGK